MNVSHKNLAKLGNSRVAKNPTILEIGAGRGEHFRFVKSDFQKYIMTDISNWGLKEVENIIGQDARVSFELHNIEKLGFCDNSFDRVICSCVLMHVDQPYDALTEMYRVVKPGGVISFYLACDPGMLLRLIRRIFITPKNNNLDVPYSLLVALNHRNNGCSIIDMCKHVFKNDQIKFSYFPFHFRSWNLSTHIIVDVVKS